MASQDVEITSCPVKKDIHHLQDVVLQTLPFCSYCGWQNPCMKTPPKVLPTRSLPGPDDTVINIEDSPLPKQDLGQNKRNSIFHGILDGPANKARLGTPKKPKDQHSAGSQPHSYKPVNGSLFGGQQKQKPSLKPPPNIRYNFYIGKYITPDGGPMKFIDFGPAFSITALPTLYCL